MSARWDTGRGAAGAEASCASRGRRRMPDMQSYGSTMQKITRSDQIESARIRELFAYWQDKRRGDLLPRRADIDPVEIPRLMPYVLIADIEHAPFRVRFRPAGTTVVAANGCRFTAKYPPK